MIRLLLLVAAGCAVSVHCYRILAFFPFPARSHHFVFRPILEELASRGHQIVYYSGFMYDKPPPNITQVLAFDEEFKLKAMDDVDAVKIGEMSVPVVTAVLYEIGLAVGRASLGSSNVQRLIHSTDERFDAVMFESYFVQEYLSSFIHKFKAVGIEVMPLGGCGWVNEMSGLPDNTAYMIDYKYEGTNKMSFWERLYNTYVTATLTAGGYFYLWKMESFAAEYFNYSGWETRPSIRQLATDRSLILTNSHMALDYPVPLAPHRKEIGGVNIKPNKPLPPDLKKFMDEATAGVIYMSFGSNVQLSDLVENRDLREDFMEAFSRFPQKVLVKWETDYPGELPGNVKTQEWFPQQDILAHKNTVLFITHGGLLSLNEAVHFGVPIVGVPIFGDQPKNLAIVEEAGFGVMLRLNNITTKSLCWAINEVITNHGYKEEVLRRSSLMKDRLLTPVKEAAYWIEYAIRHPNALTPRSAFLPAWQLHRIDILSAIVAAVLALSWLASCAFRTVCRVFCRRKQPPLKEKKH